MKFEEFEKLKKFEENSLAIALNLLYAKKYFLLMFQNIKISYSFNDCKRRIMALFCSKILSVLLIWITFIFIAWIVFIPLEQKQTWVA